jgi:putative AlgH/UPF0301 family transcriptional regulator
MERILYRQLLKVARAHDRNPMLKAVCSRQTPTGYYDFDQGEWIKVDFKKLVQGKENAVMHRTMDTWLREFLSDGDYYKPTVSLEKMVKREFRGASLQNESADFKQTLAFGVLRRLNANIESASLELSPFEFRFGTKRVALPEEDRKHDFCLIPDHQGLVSKGDFLLSNPGMSIQESSPVFFRSVIWMLDRTRGIIVNQPMSVSLHDTIEQYSAVADRRGPLVWSPLVKNTPPETKEEERKQRNRDKYLEFGRLIFSKTSMSALELDEEVEEGDVVSRTESGLRDIPYAEVLEETTATSSEETTMENTDKTPTSPNSAEGLTLDDLELFGNNKVFFGGPCSDTPSFGLLHTFPELPGATQVDPASKLCIGGNLHEAAEMVRAGNATAEQFKIIRGCASWTEVQLKGELLANTWFVVRPASGPMSAQVVCGLPETDALFLEAEHRVKEDHAAAQKKPSASSLLPTAQPGSELAEAPPGYDRFFPNCGTYGRFVWGSILKNLGEEYTDIGKQELQLRVNQKWFER